METVNKKDLASRAAANAGVDAKVAYAVTSALFEVVLAAVAAGERVTVQGFGTFEGRERAARMGRNPQNGEEIPVAARTAPAFKAAAQFKERVAAKSVQRVA
jgi:DNA-binding protein HU-beta